MQRNLLGTISGSGGKLASEKTEKKSNFCFDPDQLVKIFNKEWDKLQAKKDRNKQTDTDDNDMIENAKNWAIALKKSSI